MEEGGGQIMGGERLDISNEMSNPPPLQNLCVDDDLPALLLSNLVRDLSNRFFRHRNIALYPMA